MKKITTTNDLIDFCNYAKDFDYITVDTEFLRERTYYSKLCLIQLAVNGDGENDAVIVDPLEPELDLSPLYEIFLDEGIVKVFHAARQDLEIFFVDKGILPKPLFDTQVAAMVCGFGEQVGYETLVRKIAKQPLDKTSRFTDWSRRPLSDAQEKYALADVTHLRVIYEYLRKAIERQGRCSWVAEEIQTLLEPSTYVTKPVDAWKRIKARSNSGRFLAAVKELAHFREALAQERNIPRSRVFKDDALLELASTKPKNLDELSRSRLLLREARKGHIAEGIIKSIQKAASYDPNEFPKPDLSKDKKHLNPALADLLRVLLKAKSDKYNVAAKMIAAASELDLLASGQRDVPSLNGWRAGVFGEDALRLCNGEIGLVVNGSKVDVIALQ